MILDRKARKKRGVPLNLVPDFSSGLSSPLPNIRVKRIVWGTSKCTSAGRDSRDTFCLFNSSALNEKKKKTLIDIRMRETNRTSLLFYSSMINRS